MMLADAKRTFAESRLIGFNFPQPDGKDFVVRFGAPLDTPSSGFSEELPNVDSA